MRYPDRETGYRRIHVGLYSQPGTRYTTFIDAGIHAHNFLAVRRVFEQHFGTIDYYYLPRPHSNGDPRNHIFIQFRDAASAKDAYSRHIVMVAGVRAYVGPADETDHNLKALRHSPDH